MKTFLSLSLIIFCLNCLAQTSIIAHKSHSGSLNTLSFEGDDHLGLPSFELDSVIRINDSTLVEISHAGGFRFGQKDTVVNHPYFTEYLKNYNLEELKERYPQGITFVGFEKPEEPKETRRKKRKRKKAQKEKIDPADPVIGKNGLPTALVIILLVMSLSGLITWQSHSQA